MRNESGQNYNNRYKRQFEFKIRRQIYSTYQKARIMSNLLVSAHAFLQEVESWTITLNRQAKRLKSLKPQVQNKFKLNSIEIVLTEIDSLQIKHKKIKQKYQPFLSHDTVFNPSEQNFHSQELLTQYSQISKSFMDVLEKVALIQSQTNQPNLLVQNDEPTDNLHKKRNDKSLKGKGDAEKTFLNQTFSFKVSKENKNHSNLPKNKSIFDKRNSHKEKQQNTSIRHKAHSLIGQPKTNSLYNAKAKLKQQQYKTSSIITNEEEDTSLWQIRHQLSKISQMMKEMSNEIKFHEHQETSKEINKIENKNRKIASELKSVKEENRLMMDKIDDLKRQLMEEKKMQVDLINRFQKKSYLGSNAMYDSRATHGQNFKSINGDISHDRSKSPLTNQKGQPLENVSEWVRMRI